MPRQRGGWGSIASCCTKRCGASGWIRPEYGQMASELRTERLPKPKKNIDKSIYYALARGLR
ncbi:protein of unknown function [Rhodovastum atsumiense]|nr:protein of unknown function [Rhodovastum atsumiense]